MRRQRVAVFGSSETESDDPGFADGVRLGRLLAAHGFDLVTGGYGGMMEAVASGAAGRGVEIYGITAPTVFPERPGANPYVTREEPAPTLTERIHRILELADAALALPGGLGTLTELMMAWNLAMVAELSGARPKPLVTVGDGWAALVRFVADRFRADAGLVTRVEGVDEAVAALRAGLAGGSGGG